MGTDGTKGTRQGNRQKQVQISNQKQVQDQAYSYGTMGNFFSAMEWYANRSALEKKKQSLETIKFQHYDNFECGKIYAIKGKSGSGKTTLLSLLSGLEKCTEGNI